MRKQKPSTSARGMQSGKARLPITEYSDGLYGPLVGKPWTGGIEVHSETVEIIRSTETELRRKFGFRVGPMALVIALFAGIAAYAMLRNDRALLKDVMGGFVKHAQATPVAESYRLRFSP